MVFKVLLWKIPNDYTSFGTTVLWLLISLVKHNWLRKKQTKEIIKQYT
jgi:hypothetical protein